MLRQCQNSLTDDEEKGATMCKYAGRKSLVVVQLEGEVPYNRKIWRFGGLPSKLINPPKFFFIYTYGDPVPNRQIYIPTILMLPDFAI